MNKIKKIYEYIKNMFIYKKIKTLNKVPDEKNIDSSKNEIDFINSLKSNVNSNSSKKKIITNVCIGDGMGIQNKIEY